MSPRSGSFGQKVLGPAAKRAAIAYLQTVKDLSERRGCQTVGADRTIVRYRSRHPPEVELRTQLHGIADERAGSNTAACSSSCATKAELQV